MVYQTTQQPSGCLSACIACIFELHQDDIPVFHGGGENSCTVQYMQMRRWCESVLGVVPMPYTWSGLHTLRNHPDRLIIGRGNKQGHGHAVVATRDAIVHDPSYLGYTISDLSNAYVFATKNIIIDKNLRDMSDYSVAYLKTIRWKTLLWLRAYNGKEVTSAQIKEEAHQCFGEIK